MKRFILLLFIVILFCPCFVQAKGLTLGDLRISYEKALSKKNEYDSLTNSTKKEIKNKENALKEAEDMITNIDNQILNLEESVRESNVKIISLKEEAKNILQYLQILKGQNAYLEYVANSSSVSDLLRRMEAVSEVAFYVEDTLLSLEEEVENNKLLIEELKLEQEKLQNNVIVYQDIIVSEYGNLEDYNKYALNVNEEYEAAKNQYEAYQNLFTGYSLASSKEIILFKDYDNDLRIRHGAPEQSFNKITSFSRSLMESYEYLDEDGNAVPFSTVAEHETMNFVDVFKNRDPRMAQTFMYPGYMRPGVATAYIQKMVSSSSGFSTRCCLGIGQ